MKHVDEYRDSGLAKGLVGSIRRHRGLQAKAQRIGNYFVLVLHKLTPPVTVALLALGEAKFDGIIGPGHVSTIIGSRAWESLLLGRNA